MTSSQRDRERKCSIRGTLSFFATITINKDTDISAFLSQVLFPSHALIIQAVSDKRIIAKGIRELECLQDYLSHAFKSENELLLATDMRAMMNPTRMEVLGELADKLALRITNGCDRCQTPGFGFKAKQGALPCASCDMPSALYHEEIWGCVKCDYQAIKGRSDGLVKANPSYCDYCNP